ncbi:signal peptidase I [bacterium]|nr:MAG: signal peptidase I [bacterium]
MRKGKKRVITGFGIVLLVLLPLVFFFYLSFHTVVVQGVSMMPTFKPNQRLLVSDAYWLIGPIREKDIVVVREKEIPNGYFIKRVYRTGGEEVDYANYPKGYSIRQATFKVPEGTVFLLGDNRPQSEDSRSFGPVELSRIIGKVVVRP